MSDTKEPGCGWTQQRIVTELVEQATRQYEAGLKQVNVKLPARKYLVDGYQDGLRAAVRHLEGMGVLAVLPDGPPAT